MNGEKILKRGLVRCKRERKVVTNHSIVIGTCGHYMDRRGVESKVTVGWAARMVP